MFFRLGHPNNQNILGLNRLPLGGNGEAHVMNAMNAHFLEQMEHQRRLALLSQSPGSVSGQSPAALPGLTSLNKITEKQGQHTLRTSGNNATSAFRPVQPKEK